MKSSIALQVNELDQIHVELVPMCNLLEDINFTHRDDHYMFILQQKGILAWEVDFKGVELRDAYLSFIAPGQVHRYSKVESNEGWLVFVDPELIPKPHRDIFDTFLHIHQFVPVKDNDVIFDMIPILKETISQKESVLKTILLESVITTITGILVSRIEQSEIYSQTIGSRKYQIASGFKQLVNQNNKQYKQVKEYAQMLNITPLYLNEVIKEITGFPASHWIQQAILLEAKRLLYYTSLDVKEIANELGYEEHTYFSRFFKKNVGMTASEFRNKKT